MTDTWKTKAVPLWKEKAIAVDVPAWKQSAIPEDVSQQAMGLVERFGKQLYRGVTRPAETMAATFDPETYRGLEQLPPPQPGLFGMFKGALGAGLQAKKQAAAVAESKLIPVPPAETFTEKGVDVAAGISSFIAQLALLRKTLPKGTSNAVIWEVQNQLTGGTPGHGAAMYGVFSVPGKVIKGTGALAKTGRLAAESGLLGTSTAIGQMIDTGEINWEDVAISAGIPVAMRSIGAVKARLRRNDPQILKAVAEIHPELLEQMPNLRTVVSVTPQQMTGARRRFARYAGKLKPKLKAPTAAKEIKIRQLLKEAELVKISQDPSKARKLKTIAQQIESLDAEIKLGVGIQGKSLKNLKQIAAKHKIKIPKKATRQDVIRAISEKYKPPKIKGLEPTLIEKQPDLIPTKKYPLGVRTPEQRRYHLLWESTSAKLAEAELNQHIKEVVPVGQEIRKKAVKKLRKEQAAGGRKMFQEAKREARAKNISYLEALKRISRGFAGKAATPEFDPPKLTTEQWDIFAKRAEHVYKSRRIFDLKNTEEAITKLKGGFIPTNYEYGLLEPVLGTKTTLNLYNKLTPQKTYGWWEAPRLIRDGLKSMFGYDPQAVRQVAPVGPRHPQIYKKSVVINLKAYGSQKAADKIDAALRKSPAWDLALKEYNLNILGQRPWSTVEAGTKLQQYGEFADYLLTRKNRVLKGWGKWLRASERGANAGINNALISMAEVGEKNLSGYRARMAAKGKPLKQADVAKWRAQRGADINSLVKRIVAKNPRAKQIQQAANWVLFSPAYTVSRPITSGRALTNLIRSPGNRTYAGQVVASNIATLFALSSIGAYAGHKLRLRNPAEEPSVNSSANPTDTLFGKIRVGNEVIDLSMGEASYYRLLARIGLSVYANIRGLIKGEQITTAGGKRIPKAGEEVLRYLQSRETVLLGLTKTLLTGKDWVGQDIGRPEAIIKHFPMQFLTSMVEAGMEDGMWEAMLNNDPSQVSKALLSNLYVGGIEILGGGVLSYPVAGYKVRDQFQSVIAQRDHRTEWDDLNPIQQKRLELKYRKEFDVINNKIAAERVEKPFDRSRVEKEQQETGKYIRKRLSKDVQSALKAISLDTNRMPRDFWLNDKRLNQYTKHIIDYLNTEIPKLDLERWPVNIRRAILETKVSSAKKRAFAQLMREMK